MKRILFYFLFLLSLPLTAQIYPMGLLQYDQGSTFLNPAWVELGVNNSSLLHLEANVKGRESNLGMESLFPFMLKLKAPVFGRENPTYLGINYLHQEVTSNGSFTSYQLNLTQRVGGFFFGLSMQVSQHSQNDIEELLTGPGAIWELNFEEQYFNRPLTELSAGISYAREFYDLLNLKAGIAYLPQFGMDKIYAEELIFLPQFTGNLDLQLKRRLFGRVPVALQTNYYWGNEGNFYIDAMLIPSYLVGFQGANAVKLYIGYSSFLESTRLGLSWASSSKQIGLFYDLGRNEWVSQTGFLNSASLQFKYFFQREKFLRKSSEGMRMQLPMYF